MAFNCSNQSLVTTDPNEQLLIISEQLTKDNLFFLYIFFKALAYLKTKNCISNQIHIHIHNLNFWNIFRNADTFLFHYM